MITVSAAALRSGHRIIKVSDCNGSIAAADAIRARDARLFAHAEERQTIVYYTLADARSGVMRDFGPGWFSLARRQLDNPPIAFGAGATAPLECPSCGSDDVEKAQGGMCECCTCGHDFDPENPDE